MKAFIVCAGFVALAGCASEPQQAVQTSTQSPTSTPAAQPTTPTVVNSGLLLTWTRPVMKTRELKPQEQKARLKALAKHEKIIKAYFENVDKAVLAMLNSSSIPNMKHNDWKRSFGPDTNGEYGASFWINDSAMRSYRPFTCYAWSYDGCRPVQAVQTVWIGKKAHDMSFYWYIGTGDKALDKKLAQIAVDEAEKF